MTARWTPDENLARARRDAQAARLLCDGGFYDQAISRAYFAAFQAATAAIAALGQVRSKHSGVISAFGKYVVRDGGFDCDDARSLPRLFDARNAADYGAQAARKDEAARAIEDAEHFTDAVARWLADRSDTPTST